MRKSFAFLLLTSGFFWACMAAPRMPFAPAEQGKLSRSLEGQFRFLRISFFLTPFFGDESKFLLAPSHPSWLHLLEHSDGTPVYPGDVQEILPAGSPVYISRVEFPSSSAIRKRPLYSPRSRTWVFLSSPTSPKPLLLILPNTFKNTQDFLAEVNRFLSPLNPSSQISEFSSLEQTAVHNKEAFPGICAEALEMALGYPETKTFSFENNQKTETWSWNNGKKTIRLRAGRVLALP